MFLTSFSSGLIINFSTSSAEFPGKTEEIYTLFSIISGKSSRGIVT